MTQSEWRQKISQLNGEVVYYKFFGDSRHYIGIVYQEKLYEFYFWNEGNTQTLMMSSSPTFKHERAKAIGKEVDQGLIPDLVASIAKDLKDGKGELTQVTITVPIKIL